MHRRQVQRVGITFACLGDCGATRKTHHPAPWVARELGVSHEKLGEAMHTIKNEAGLTPRDRVSIWDNGDITDDTDTWIGNVHDEN
jgi:hypothetical protein